MKETVKKQNHNSYFVSISIQTNKQLILGGINEQYRK